MASEKIRIKSEFIRRLDLAMQRRGCHEDKQLAQDADISAPSISGWRNGPSMPSKRALKALAMALNVDVDWLNTNSDSEPNWSEARQVKHIAHVSDSINSANQISFQAFTIPFQEAGDDWLIENIEHFYNEMMEADDCRTRLSGSTYLVNLIKEFQDRLNLEWLGKREHLPRANDVLDKLKENR